MRPVSGRNSTIVLPSRTPSLRQRVCAGLPPACRRVADHPPARLGARHLAQRQVDQPLLALDLAAEHGEIDLSRPCRLRTPACDLGAGARVAREQQAARRVLVEPVHRRRRTLEPEHQFLRCDIRCCRRPARGASTGRPAGLSMTIASPSMNKIRSSRCMGADATGRVAGTLSPAACRGVTVMQRRNDPMLPSFTHY